MIGETIRRRRKARGWSQQALADAAGISQNYVSDIERGKRTGTLDILQAIATALDLTLDELRQPLDSPAPTRQAESPEDRLKRWIAELSDIGEGLTPAEQTAVLDHARALRDRRGR